MDSQNESKYIPKCKSTNISMDSQNENKYQNLKVQTFFYGFTKWK